jgi:pimeloyl-[acyl-carrier protein] methyl ester esterase
MAETLPLVLLHGWGVHGGLWQAVKPELDAYRNVLAVDLPGYGSSASVQPYTADGLAQTLARQVAEPCIVCGWSMGGMVAQAWAAQRPEQVRGLILVSSSPAFVRRPDWLHGLAPDTLAEFASALTQDYRATLLRFLALQARGGESARAVTAVLRGSLLDRPEPDPSVLAAGLELLRSVDLRACVGKIRCPTLIVHGACDPVCPKGAGDWLAEAIPGASLAVHPAAAHAPFISHPDWFVEQVNAFVRDIE